MSVEELQAALNDIRDEIEVVVTENLVYERTVQKMEKRELEIEASLPPFTYKFPWETEGAVKGAEIKTIHPDAICGVLSDDEPDPPDGIYRPYIPADDPTVNREAIGRLIQVGEEEAGHDGHSLGIDRYLKRLGEIPPSNFDPIRHKYGDLVRFATYDGKDGLEPSDDPFASELPNYKGKNVSHFLKTLARAKSALMTQLPNVCCRNRRLRRVKSKME